MAIAARAVLHVTVLTVAAPFDNTAQAAHLGGLLTGVAFIRWGPNATRALAEWNPLQRIGLLHVVLLDNLSIYWASTAAREFPVSMHDRG